MDVEETKTKQREEKKQARQNPIKRRGEGDIERGREKGKDSQREVRKIEKLIKIE